MFLEDKKRVLFVLTAISGAALALINGTIAGEMSTRATLSTVPLIVSGFLGVSSALMFSRVMPFSVAAFFAISITALFSVISFLKVIQTNFPNFPRNSGQHLELMVTVLVVSFLGNLLIEKSFRKFISVSILISFLLFFMTSSLIKTRTIIEACKSDGAKCWDEWNRTCKVEMREDHQGICKVERPFEKRAHPLRMWKRF